MATAKKNSKPIFKTASPYGEPTLPQLTPTQRDNVLDLLCSLLQPLGDHRKAHHPPSKGKKRKQSSSSSADAKPASPSGPAPGPAPGTPPPPPDLAPHVLVGINAVTRHLEALAAQTAPPTLSTDDSKDAAKSQLQPLTLILIPSPPNPALPHAHLPTLVALASLHTPDATATRLLAVPPSLEPRIADALQIPRVGAIGLLEGAPGAEALADYVRGEVGRVESKVAGERGVWRGVGVEGAAGR